LAASKNMTKEQIDAGGIEKIEKHIIQIAKSHNIKCGYHIIYPTKKIIRYKIKMGYDFIALGCDSIILGEACIGIVNKVMKK